MTNRRLVLFARLGNLSPRATPNHSFLCYNLIPGLHNLSEAQMRQTVLIRYLAVLCALSVFGCKNAANPNNSSESAGTQDAPREGAANAPDGSASPSSGSADSGSVASNLKAVFAPKPIMVKPGTEIVVVADQEVSSKTSNSGDQFEASVAEPVVVGDRVVIPK